MKSLKKEKRNNKLGMIIINIFYQLFIFIIFFFLLLITLLIIYKYSLNYLKKLFYNIKLTDVYYDIKSERRFNYNFKIDDYVYLKKKMYKIIDIYSKRNDKKTYLKLLLKDSKVFINISIDYENNEIMYLKNKEIINNFKYISNKSYYIPFYMEYIYIYKNDNNDDYQKSNFKNIINFKNVKDVVFNNSENIKKMIIDFSNSKDFQMQLLNLITDNYYTSEICNLKLKYKGSKRVKLKDLKEKKIFRGTLFFENNNLYQNNYDIIFKKKNEMCKKLNNNINDVINNCNQSNLFLILIKACINISKFQNNKKLIDYLSFYIPNLNIFLKEIINLFFDDNEIYTSIKLENNTKVKKIINDNSELNYKLLQIDYNIILFILNNSTDDFLRLLYNNYDGICYSNNKKLIYIKLKNKLSKKYIFNKI